jgi:hypothetical protein
VGCSNIGSTSLLLDVNKTQVQLHVTAPVLGILMNMYVNTICTSDFDMSPFTRVLLLSHFEKDSYRQVNATSLPLPFDSSVVNGIKRAPISSSTERFSCSRCCDITTRTVNATVVAVFFDAHIRAKTSTSTCTRR